MKQINSPSNLLQRTGRNDLNIHSRVFDFGSLEWLAIHTVDHDPFIEVTHILQDALAYLFGKNGNERRGLP